MYILSNNLITNLYLIQKLICSLSVGLNDTKSTNNNYWKHLYKVDNI